MRSAMFYLKLVSICTILLLGETVNAWNRHSFNRYSRNWIQTNADDMRGVVGVGNLNGGNGIVSNKSPQINDFNALFGLGNDVNLHGVSGEGGPDRRNILSSGVSGGDSDIGGGEGVGGNILGFSAFGAGYDIDTGGGYGGQQQTEIYGIVEPLIEDTPCADRACQVNGDCCPTGVCVNTYGEGKCVYVYGRKRDLCFRNTDCEMGMSCLKSIAGNLMCQPVPPSTIHLSNNMVGGSKVGNSIGGSIIGAGVVVGADGVGIGNNAVGLNVGTNIAPKLPLTVKQFGDNCLSSSDCNIAKGLCCQLQRTHHRIRPRKLCAYFRDPFMCIDMMAKENEKVQDSRLLSAFSQGHM